MNTFWVALSSVLLSVSAQFALKIGVESRKLVLVDEHRFFERVANLIFDKFVLFGFLLYGLGALVWLSVLEKWDVSKAYPIVGLGFAISALVGYLMGENLSPLRVCGVALICIGVAFVGRS